MAQDFLLANVRIVFPGDRTAPGTLLIRDGRIQAVDPEPGSYPRDIAAIDGGGRFLTPGLIDVHTHGIGKYRYEASADELVAATGELAAYGCTCLLPTIVPKAGDTLLPELEKLAEALDRVDRVAVPGLHLEGPFMALPGAGCATMPGDLDLLEAMLTSAHGRIAAMSVSPETPNILPVIERLVELGIVPMVTHTQANVPQTLAALAAGARHATHFYDVFYAPEETDPGVRPVGCVEVFLADPQASIDFICDGVHVDPVAVRAGVAAKGYEKVLLITDSNLGAGLPPGVYPTPKGYEIEIRPEGGARISGDHPLAGTLSGSALTMNRGMANLMAWLDLPPEQIWAIGTANPARLIGLPSKGGIFPGADADLVLWNDDFEPARTWVGGRCVYEAEKAPV